MGTIVLQDIADRAWTVAGDKTGGAAVRWLPDEAMWWLNDAQRETVKLVPRIGQTRATPTLVTGTRQTLAALGLARGHMVLDVYANVSSGGARGQAIKRGRRAWYDQMLPDWHRTTAVEEADEWIPDETDPAAFFVYPPVIAGGKVELLYSDLPADVADISSAMTLDDKWAVALRYFLLYSFFSKNNKAANGLQLATTFFGLWQSECGVDPQTIAANTAAIMNKAKGA